MGTEKRITEAYQDIINCIGELGYPVNDANFKDTANRCYKALIQFVFPKTVIENEIDRFLEKTFPSTIDEMIIETNIKVVCLCPHHLLPAEMIVSLAYIPDKNVLGLSKLARIAQMLGNQPILQEDYTEQLANVMNKLKPLGVGVYVRGKHGCMRFRGIRADSTEVITTKLIGNFKNISSTRQEFLSLCVKS